MAATLMIDPGTMALDLALGNLPRSVETAEVERLTRVAQPFLHPGMPRITGQEASPLLQRARAAVEADLAVQVERFSRMQWLWLLRRLPERMFAGELPSTSGYDQQLAEVISERSSTHGQIWNDPKLGAHYPIDASVAAAVARFCAGVRVLSGIHSDLRWAGKGADFAVPVEGMLRVEPSTELERAVSLYDDRVYESSGFFHVTGSDFGDINTPPSADEKAALLLVGRVDRYMCTVPQGPFQGENLLAQYTLRALGLRKLGAFVGQSRLAGARWWRDDAGALLLFLMLGVASLGRHKQGLVSIPRCGYLLTSRAWLVQHFDEFLPVLLPMLAETFGPTLHLSTTGDDVVARLEALTGGSWPLQPGAVLRSDSGALCLDYATATMRIRKAFEYPKTTGDIANARAEHFEEVVQGAVDATTWRPDNSIRGSRRKELRIGGKAITDVDAIGMKEGRLLLISCKSLIYSADYDVGDHRSVRNAAATIATAWKTWQDTVAAIRLQLKGDNYDFSAFSEVIGIVCTPWAVFTSDKEALADQGLGLRNVCSLEELRMWLAR